MEHNIVSGGRFNYNSIRTTVVNVAQSSYERSFFKDSCTGNQSPNNIIQHTFKLGIDEMSQPTTQNRNIPLNIKSLGNPYTILHNPSSINTDTSQSHILNLDHHIKA